MKVGIIQPARLGDLIILLPAAKYIHDSGNEVFWPVLESYAWMFCEIADYINFIPIDNKIESCVNNAKKALVKHNVQKIFDVACAFCGSNSTQEYNRLGAGCGSEKFDAFKYRHLGVPLEEKWKLRESIKRNFVKENEVYDDLVSGEKDYSVVGLKYSKGEMKVKINNLRNIVFVNEKYNIFHWIKILENAKEIHLVDSSMAQLVEQLNLTNKKIFYSRSAHLRPTIKNEWEIV